MVSSRSLLFCSLAALVLFTGSLNTAQASGYTFTTLTGFLGGSLQGVAVDSSGNVYVADNQYSTIRKITPGGVVTTVAGAAGVGGSADGTGSAARFLEPSGVAVDSSGNLYVADGGNDTIRKVVISTGVVTTIAGMAGVPGSSDGTGSAARFNYPSGVAVDSSGNLYVADTNNYTIRKVAISTGAVTTIAGSAGGIGGSADGTGSAARFLEPFGVAVDSSGNLYVADSSNDTIREITPDGVVTTIAGTGGAVGSADGTGTAARFNTPYGVAVDSSGNVYVADTQNSTIREITPGGVVTTIAGMAGVVGSADGTGTAARFNYPIGVAVDSSGNVYVADTGNGTVREDVQPSTANPAAPGAPTGVSAVAGDRQATVSFTPPLSTGGVPISGYTVTASPSSGSAVTATGVSSPIIVTGLSNGSAYTFTVAATNAAGAGPASAASTAVTPSVAALPSVTLSGSSFDFVNGIVGNSPGGGDLSGSSYGFYCNNDWQRGVVDLGNLGDVPFDDIAPPTTGYAFYGVPAIVGDTYVALISTISNAQYAMFRVTGLTSTSVTFEYQVYVGSNQPLGFLVQPGADCFWASVGPPATLKVLEGQSDMRTLAATAVGPNVTYQWQKDGVSIPGATLPTIVFNDVTTIVSGSYRLIISNASGSLLSNPVQVTVLPLAAPTFISQPNSTVFFSTGTGYTTLNFTYTGVPPTYPTNVVFTKDGTQLVPAPGMVTPEWAPDATNPSSYTAGLNLGNATSGGIAGVYTATVTNSRGTVTSSPVTVEVGDPPSVTTQPVSQTVSSGATAVFTVTTTGTQPLTFQWQQNGNPVTAGVVSSGNTSTLTLTNVESVNAGNYNVRVANNFGQATSTTASLSVVLAGTPPAISQPITSQTVTTGATASFTVNATGTAPLSYAWTQNGNPINSGVASSGGTSTLTLTGVTTVSSGSYTVAVSNGLGIASSSAILTVNPSVLPPTIVSGFTAAGTFGSPFAYTIAASNSPTSFSASGLPAGLGINTSTGAITGTPTAAGIFIVTIGATNSGGTALATLTLTVQQPVPVITSAATASARAGSPFAGYTILASNSPTSFGASSLPAGLSLNPSTGVISGTPSASGTYVVNLTASNSSGTSAVFPLTLSIAQSLNVPVVSSSPTASGTANEGFVNYTITASNSPTSFSATGLPAGLTLDPATGIISGIPTLSGIFTVSVSATNSVGAGPALQLTITIAQAASAPVITSNLSAGATVGSPFSYAITASDAILVFGATGLPSNLTVNPSTGVISGTPTETGTFGVTLEAANSSGTGTAVLDLTVAPGFSAPVISSSSEVSGQVGIPFAYTILANNTPTSFSAAGLPSGLTLSPATGVISGTPSLAGTFTVSMTAGNATGMGQPFSLVITIASPPQAPAITSAATAIGTVGTPLAYVITTTVAASGYSATGLPTGLSLDPVAGVISGTPSAAGTSFASISATNSVGTGAPLTLIIAVHASAQAPSITSSLTAIGTQGQAFAYTITANNMPALPLPAGDGYNATGLPTGIGINPFTGVISGTPATVGTTSVVLTATNDTGASEPVTLTITINPAAGAPSVTSGNTAAATVGTGFTYQIEANPAATSYGITGNPAWLGINTATGVLAGTPNGAPGVYIVSLTATNSAGTSAPVALTITVAAISGTPVVVSTALPPGGTAGTTYPDTSGGCLYQIQALPSTQIQYYFVNGILPAGLSLDPALGLIYGTPTAPGTYTVAVGAANEIGVGTAAEVTLTISAAAGTPQVTNTGGSGSSALAHGIVGAEAYPTATGTVGAAFSYQITASGSPTAYAATGLPAGLAVNPTTGLITGTPTTAGISTVLISAANSKGVGAGTSLIITISPPASAPSITSSPTDNSIAGTAYFYHMAASNSPTSYNASGLPAGLFPNSTTGLISGTPTTPGVYSIALSANNASGTGSTEVLTLTIAAAVGAPAITSASTTNATVGSSFSAYHATASNGPITSYAAINLPPGLVMDTTAGTISGTPTVVGAYTATLTATNAAGQSSPFALLITVSPASTSSTVTSAAGASTTSGAAFNYQITASNSPVSFNVTGLPSGLSVNPATGVISGSASFSGTYQVTISANNATGTGASFTLTINVVNPSSYAYLDNLSARAFVGTGGNILIAGFGTSGSGTKNLLLRGVGPGMYSTFQVPGALQSVQLAFYDGENPAKLIASNTGWANSPVTGNSPVSAIANNATSTLMANVGAFAYATGSLDAALAVTVPGGSFTSQVVGQGSSPTGVALAEVYDADVGIPSVTLINLSARVQVGTGFNVLIGGFSIAGNTSEKVLIRGVGPGLANTFQLTGTLVQPLLQLYDSENPAKLIAQNSGWNSTPTIGNSPVVAIVAAATATDMNTVGAFGLVQGSADAAMEVTLPPGQYTAELSGVGGTTGIGLVEVYAMH